MDSLIKQKRLLTSNEQILYYCICTFCIIACFTALLEALHLRLFSKVLQLISLFLIPVLLILIKRKNKSRYKSNIIRITIILMVYGIILLVVSIVHLSNRIPLDFIIQSFLQIFFLYFWIYTSFSLNDALLDKSILFIKKIFVIGVLFSLIELIIPTSIKLTLISYIYGSIPPNFLSRDIDLGLMRLGSFYFNPLTYSYTLLFLICYGSLSKRYTKYLYLLMSLIAQTKTAFLGGIFMLLGLRIKNWLLGGLILTVILVITICIYFDGWFFYYAFDGTALKSLANHLSGLVFGINSGFDNLWGNGLGKSGYIIFILAQSNNIDLSHLFETTIFEKGDESTLGIISYQLGGIFLLIHSLLFCKIFYNQIKYKNYSIASFTLIMILFQIFSESPLTLLITFSQAFLFANLNKKIDESSYN